MTTLTRRDFFKHSGKAALLSLFANRQLIDARESNKQIGLQLYTVRDLMQKDVFGTLKQVAKVGYKEVEFAGYFNVPPKELKKVLDELGLKSPSTHISIEDLRDKLETNIEIAKTLDHQFIVCPGFPITEPIIDSYKTYAALSNKIGETLQKAGIQFAYHNHDLEFKTVDRQIPFDVFLAETDEKLVQIEIDLYWITKAGKDPLTYFKKYPGRFSLWHVKDMDNDGKIVDVGKGTIEFTKIFGHAREAGLKHYFVEHDDPKDAIQTITTSFEYLH
jgi:sugar phosphate isomerase/epimerase